MIKILIIASVVMVLLVGGYFILVNTADENKKDLDRICVNDECFFVEIVDTPEARQKGLMYREQLDDNTGMFFIFDEEGLYPFWMKNTLIPLDIIWISDDLKIVFIASAFPCESDPCPSYNLVERARYVLEINEGLAVKRGIRVGDNVELNFKKN